MERGPEIMHPLIPTVDAKEAESVERRESTSLIERYSRCSLIFNLGTESLLLIRIYYFITAETVPPPQTTYTDIVILQIC
jgi:hypothetical protein